MLQIIDGMKMLMKTSVLSLVLGAILFSGCTKEDDYAKYLEGGEIYYPGKISNAFVLSGKNRVRFYGLFLSDPKVTQLLVYWNIRQDSVVIPVARVNIVDTLNYVLDPIEEGIHNFEFITMDSKGNKSVVVNATGTSYGDKYAAQLTNRPIQSHTYDATKKTMTIKWASMDLTTGAYQTEVQYTTADNNVKQILVPFDESNVSSQTTVLENFPAGSFKYRTHFRPDDFSIDIFFTAFTVVE